MTVDDIFGAVSQTIQGADRIAEIVKALVLMPDFTKGEPLPLSIYPLDTDKKMKTAKDSTANVNIEKSVEKLAEAFKEAKGKEEVENVKSEGACGLCWGGKIRCPRYL
ncbi:hypothetical protein N7G274_005870 [Stereocaulon virgatum]|uniref:Uncharacterized protein n=1 Tax=Stereocaulon virgatum TaxID=373712 RepID=A0ABR4A727_9LECA